MKRATELSAAVAFAALGMLGLHFGVEYSGWLIFVAIAVAL